jgi:hypothetical protein
MTIFPRHIEFAWQFVLMGSGILWGHALISCLQLPENPARYLFLAVLARALQL